MNILGVQMKVRYFKPLEYWVSKVNEMIDILYIENYDHEEAHIKAKSFFMNHGEYTHMLLLNDDLLITPSHISLLMEDVEHFKDECVVCGYSNVGFSNPWVNISFTDLRGVNVMYMEQYRFPSVYDALTGALGYPFARVFFQGYVLTCIPRWIAEKLSFKPYKRTVDSLLGRYMYRGTMFDLQMSIELADMDVPVVCDTRLLVMHFGDTRRYIDLRRPRRMYLRRRDGSIEWIRV